MKGPTYQGIVLFLRRLMRIFFRRVEVTGLDGVPAAGGGILVAWHPNGLVDPGLILATFPRRVVFGARHGLFKWPLLGWLMRAIGTVPIYRRADAGPGDDVSRQAANRRSLDALAHVVAAGSFAALFPEGTSHDEPHPLSLKGGAARLWVQAHQVTAPGAPPPVILPVGLHYDHKRGFGSRALVVYHPPLALAPDLTAPPPLEAPEEAHRDHASRVTAEIERVLGEVVYATESWEVNRTMHRARKLVRAERAARAGARPGKPDMVERTLAFARLWHGYRERLRSHPREAESLVHRVGAYHEDLRSLGLEDHELDGNPPLGSPWVAAVLGLQALFVYLLLPPILVIGYLINGPTLLALAALARTAARKKKDEATLKVLAGTVAFPLTWAVTALLVGWGQTQLHLLYPRIPDAPVLTGLLAFALSALGAAVALVYHRLAAATARAIRVRFTRARRAGTVARLRRERGRLFEEIMVLAEGLELPGRVAADGKVVEAPG